jgi:hypothetical protein
MESAIPECQSLRTTGELPEELPASSSADVILFAMAIAPGRGIAAVESDGHSIIDHPSPLA